MVRAVRHSFGGGLSNEMNADAHANPNLVSIIFIYFFIFTFEHLQEVSWSTIL